MTLGPTVAQAASPEAQGTAGAQPASAGNRPRARRFAGHAPALALARQTLMYAWTQRLPAWALGLGVLCLGAGWFFGTISFAGQVDAARVTAAALLRMALAVLVAVSCVAVVQADLSERFVEMLLGAGLARWQWVGGRLAACALFAAVVSLCAALPLAVWAAQPSALLWALSLALEMALLGCASVAAALSLAGLAVPVLAVLAFYALSRSMDALLAMAAYGAQDGVLWSSAALWVVRALSWLMPRLDGFAPAAWLTTQPAVPLAPSGWAAMLPLAASFAHVLVYGLLLCGVALVDAYRKRF